MGVVCVAKQRTVRFTQVTIIGEQIEFPVFESVLGGGHVYHLTSRGEDRSGTVWSFLVGVKFRHDRQVNATLHRLYPRQAFAVDVAVVQLGGCGRIIPLHRLIDRVQAVMAIQRQACSFHPSINTLTRSIRVIRDLDMSSRRGVIRNSRNPE